MTKGLTVPVKNFYFFLKNNYFQEEVGLINFLENIKNQKVIFLSATETMSLEKVAMLQETEYFLQELLRKWRWFSLNIRYFKVINKYRLKCN